MRAGHARVGQVQLAQSWRSTMGRRAQLPSILLAHKAPREQLATQLIDVVAAVDSGDADGVRGGSGLNPPRTFPSKGRLSLSLQTPQKPPPYWIEPTLREMCRSGPPLTLSWPNRSVRSPPRPKVKPRLPGRSTAAWRPWKWTTSAPDGCRGLPINPR